MPYTASTCCPTSRTNPQRGRGPRPLKIKLQTAVHRIRKAAIEVFDFLRASGAPVPPRGKLIIDCPVVRKHRAGGDLRAFFHIGHRGVWTVCGAHEAGLLPDSHLYGLLLHEFGHPMAWKIWGRSRQQDADRAIFDTTEVPILYKSGIVLQWITAADVQAIRSAR